MSKKSLVSGSRLIIAGLGVANIGLAYLVWDRWSRDIDTSAIITGAAEPASDAANANSTMLSPPPKMGDLSQTTARPIFNMTRRPIEPKKAVAETQPQVVAPPAVPPEQLLLVGVLQTGSGGDKALIRDSSESPGSWMLIGDSVQGWQIRSISSEMAVIENAGQQYELRISYDSKAADSNKTASLTR